MREKGKRRLRWQHGPAICDSVVVTVKENHRNGDGSGARVGVAMGRDREKRDERKERW